MNIEIKNIENLGEAKKVISLFAKFKQDNFGKIDFTENDNVKTILKNENGLQVKLKIKNGKISLKKVA